MWEELLNSKMFWLFAAVVSGLITGELLRRFTRSKQSYTSLGMPIIGVALTVLILFYVKLNVAFFHLKYTVAGLGIIVVISAILGYLMYLYSNKKTNVFYSIAFMYTAICMMVFYVFYKEKLKINVTVCPDTSDIYLLLKKEDAGFFEINESGIGYVGRQLFNDGFRPEFLRQGRAVAFFDHTPVAVEIPTKRGLAHALCFTSNLAGANRVLNLDSLMEGSVVNADELQFGSLNEIK